MSKDFFKRILNGKATVQGSAYITQERHWGASVVLDANTRIHFIDGEPSAHFHRYRTEDYILQIGEMEVYSGKWFENDLEKTIANLSVTRMGPGDRIVIPPLTVHIPLNVSKTPSTFIEISHGPYEEADIVRVYDKNARDPELVKKWNALGYKSGISIKDLVRQVKKSYGK